MSHLPMGLPVIDPASRSPSPAVTLATLHAIQSVMAKLVVADEEAARGGPSVGFAGLVAASVEV